MFTQLRDSREDPNWGVAHPSWYLGDVLEVTRNHTLPRTGCLTDCATCYRWLRVPIGWEKEAQEELDVPEGT